MPLPNPFASFALGDLFDTVLPDFVLAFAFFTSIVYAVLSRRFGEQRPAVAMSAALGGTLAIGLVWWEYTNDLSIRKLGPIAVGFAILILGGVIYQAVRGAGGSWAGAGIALGATLLVGWTLGIRWPVDRAIVQTLMMVALTVGVLAFLLHRPGPSGPAFQGSARWSEPAFFRNEATDLFSNERTAIALFLHVRASGAPSRWATPVQAAHLGWRGMA